MMMLFEFVVVRLIAVDDREVGTERPAGIFEEFTYSLAGWE